MQVQPPQSAAPFKLGRNMPPGRAILTEWNAIQSQIDSGKSQFTLAIGNTSKDFTVQSYGDKVKVLGGNMRYANLEVEEQQSGKPETKATTTFTLGSADGVNNMIWYARTPAAGGATTKIPVDLAGYIDMPADQIPPNIWP